MDSMKWIVRSALLVVAGSAFAGGDCLTLAFQGNVGGKVEDCGCPKRPLGGLPHRAQLLQEMQATCANTLVVDAGNLLGAPEFEGGQAQTEFLLSESQRMGYRVLGIGRRDLNFGYEFLVEAAKSHGIALVSSNVRRGDAPAFEPWHVETVNGVRIGFASLSAGDTRYTKAGLNVAEPDAALAAVLPSLREQSDVIVLLSALDRGETRKLIEALPADHGIDFAIEGESSDHWQSAQNVNGVAMLAANSQGKYLGQLDLTLQDGHWTGDYEMALHEVDIQKKSDAEYAARLKKFAAERDKVAAGSR